MGERFQVAEDGAGRLAGQAATSIDPTTPCLRWLPVICAVLIAANEAQTSRR